MAQITGGSATQVLSIKDFLGLNENPDGDTNLKIGELSQMRDFAITGDRHLQIRPGQKTLLDLRAIWEGLPDKPVVDAPVGSGVWTGLIGGVEHTVASYGGVLWDLSLDPQKPPRDIGRATQDDTSFFGFSDKLYLLNGHEYLSWDGGAETKFQTVEGYIPTVTTASPPGGGGPKLENANRLTGKRKAKFSPDGKATVFHLPEKEVDEIIQVEGTGISYTLQKAEGTVTFSSAVPSGTNTLIITYRKGNGERGEVTGMHYAELFNGETDSRVFLYGDGSNRAIYSGNDFEKAVATAEYFPDLYELRVGEANAPITALIRHYGRLLAFKEDSTWSVDVTVIGIPGGGSVTAFPVSPVNKALGNQAAGQVKLLRNNPLSFTEGGVYQWKASGNISTDHRDANRVSERVRSTLSTFDFKKLKTFNFIQESEFWIMDTQGRCLVLNYQNDTWYLYQNMPYGGMTELGGELYGFCADGRIVHISRRYRNDDGKDIRAYAETGAMDFDRDWMLKYSAQLFVAIQPEYGGRVTVTVETNRRSDFAEKVVSAGLTTFRNADFRHWSFGTNRKPQVRRIRMKAKKAAFYKLIFKSDSASATATVLQTDIQVRYTGKVK